MFRSIYFITYIILFQSIIAVGQSREQNQLISISFHKVSLSQALTQLQHNIEDGFAFDPAIIPSDKFITQEFVKTRLSIILDQLLFGTGLTYTTVGSAMVIVKKQLRYTISGYIRDRDSGEALIGASIHIPKLKATVITNQYGFYSITIPEGDYELSISNIGFMSETKQVHLNQNTIIDYDLVVKLTNLSEVAVGVNKTDSAYAQNSAKSISTSLLNHLPYYTGEVDLVKALQMQNGIKALTEGGAGLFVRGGNIDQNLIMLDEAMIYNPSHLFGLVSVFNSDAIKNVQIYNDHIPANYGGRLSSVIDTRMAEGNNKEFHVKGGLNLLSVRVAAEGPIKKETGSFLVTFRRSVIDLLKQNFNIVNQNSNYYDLNVKTNYRINAGNKLYYSFYYGHDRLSSKNSYINKWGNVTSTVRLNHVFNSRLFFNLSGVYSNYKNQLDVNADTISEKYQWQTGVQDFSFKGDFTFYKSLTNELKFGAIGTLHHFTPGEASKAYPNDFNIPQNRSEEYAAYFSHNISFKRVLQLNYGLRAGIFNNKEDRLNEFDDNGNRLDLKEYRTYKGIQPRLNLIVSLDRVQRIHATYNHNYQYLQLIQNNELAFSSLETWMPSSAKTKPQQSDYLSVGYDYSPGKYKVSFNLYYKNLRHQLSLINHAQIIQNPEIRDQLRAGTSHAYGTELNISKTTGKFTSDLAYSFSRVFRKINGINNNERFPANYDIPHDFKFINSYTFSNQLSVTSFFTYTSGRPVTLPVGYYTNNGIKVPIFEGRNSSRFPDFNKLDVSAQYHLIHKNKSSGSTFSVGVYNIYNRRNPLFYRVKQTSQDEISGIESGIGITPWIAYSFKL